MDAISVLVVDDSALMRNLIGRIIESTPGLAVAGKAMNGSFAIDKIPLVKPDVIVLDIEMPVMNGVEFLKERKKRGIDIPVIILSSIAREGAAVTMECLALGASDFITKPSGSDSADISKVAHRLAELLVLFGGQYAKSHQKKIELRDPSAPLIIPPVSPSPVRAALAVKKPAGPVVPLREGGKIEIIAIGISTGGPNALREVFAAIDPDVSQPIVVVQHMPAGFTEEFAKSLNTICPLEVKEAKEGDLLKKGRVLIAPGNKHMTVEQRTLASLVHLSDADQCNGHRPSVDVLFESVAKQYQNRALGVIMTGMGKDGAVQLAEMRKQGAYTLGQDEETSIVYGMPKVAYEYGGVQKQVPLSAMAAEISSLAKRHS